VITDCPDGLNGIKRLCHKTFEALTPLKTYQAQSCEALSRVAVVHEAGRGENRYEVSDRFRDFLGTLHREAAKRVLVVTIRR
jgi:broad specificity phosphatase PhoE